MDENIKVHEGDTPIEDNIPMEEKNTTVSDEMANSLVSTVSSSIETVAQELGKSQPSVLGNEKSNRFQNQ
jgi:hypothetical protein